MMFNIFINFCSYDYCLDLTIKLSEFITIFCTIIAFIIALFQYRKTQKWKRSEFVYQLITDFKNDFNVRRGLLILDWNRVPLPLKDNEIKDEKFFLYDDEMLISALRFHLNKEEFEGFNQKDLIIRLILDDFFDKLGMFNIYIKKGLIKKNDIVSYLSYWIEIIADNNNTSKSFNTRKLILDYIDNYKFTEVGKLCELFGYKISY